MNRLFLRLSLTLAVSTSAVAQMPPVHPEIWPQVAPAIPRNAALEKRIDALLARMTLEQKVGQVIQPSITTIKPEDVRTYHLGSVLNGGGGWPGDVRKAKPSDWLALADAFYEASMDTSGGRLAIPVMWGTDAVHGHNNIVGATLFPHNVGLGAMRNPDLIRRIGEVTAAEMRTTGIDWNFSPTVAVARDSRWGRAYESWSEEPQVVREYAEAMIRGLQGDPRSPGFLGRGKVIATAKHFLADGGTEGGRDQGDVLATEVELRDIHGAGYVGALRGGVQVVMASYNSWHGAKMHGVGELLTDVLKKRMGFDGLVVGDWNGHGQVTGCTNASCPQSFNAGVDIFMVPEDWKALYQNTLEQVKSGQITRARLDDAVRRILRVKLRAGLFTAGKPSSRPLGGEFARLGSPEHRAVARQAVRESLVLLKNNGRVLPLRARQHVLIAGDGADSIAKQSGGWTLTWQGDGNTNADFPGGTSIGAGLRSAVEAAGGRVTMNADGSYEQKPDVAVVVFGEDPYAEFQGDRATVIYEGDKDVALLRKLKAAGIPVVSVFLSGRPLWVNPHLNASDAFVAAWLPGTEGGGVADVLTGKHDFKGKLSFSWPKLPTQSILNRGAAGYDPLFPFGFGLTYADSTELPQQTVDMTGVDQSRPDVYFAAGKPVGQWTLRGPGATITTVERGAEIRWPGTSHAEVALRGGRALDLSRESNGNLALAVEVMVHTPPTQPVQLGVAGGTVDITSMLRALPLHQWQTIRVRLRCFADKGADMTKVDVPFRIATVGELAIGIADARLVSVANQECPSDDASRVMFDDFNYATHDEMRSNDWIIRSAPGWPGVPGATWGPESVTLHDGIVRMTSSTDGTPANTRQNQICHQRKYREGTYAARVRFTDAPVSGPNGDQIVQTFYKIAPQKAPMDLDYSEADFEYLPNGGWGKEGATMWATTWETFRLEPWLADNENASKPGSQAGWRTLVTQIANDRVKYYVDGQLLGDHGGRTYPEVHMSINFNLWFIRDGLAKSPEMRRWEEDIDWVYFNQRVLSPADVEREVAQFRARGTKYRDTVPELGLNSPCDF